ncbi:hypothetical protein [Sigmofec virus UA08Rod_4577]|uniref:Uncharacterized protein n=1 Tax=Sigmofec virus UA08Rod_4577 TaxID=2929404 RepID=A0A976N033_9VIRU|nr:hypothetical protein [Sigmofec virus UA08Rod_4577]
MDRRLMNQKPNVSALQKSPAIMSAMSQAVNAIGSVATSSIGDGQADLHSQQEAANDKKNITTGTSVVASILAIVGTILSFV